MISCAISPCPNDIWTFSGLLSKAVSSRYNLRIATLGELNLCAINGEVSITKISAGCYPKIRDRYVITSVGASFGSKEGPKLVVRSKDAGLDLNDEKIVTPSLTSSASFVTQIMYPKSHQVSRGLYEIPFLVQRGEFRAGIIVNEAMNELEKYDLCMHSDLASVWKEKTGNILPLGLVVAANVLSDNEISTFETDVRSSIKWAFENPRAALIQVLKYSSEKDESVIKAHIENFTSDSKDNFSFKQTINSFCSIVENSFL